MGRCLALLLVLAACPPPANHASSTPPPATTPTGTGPGATSLPPPSGDCPNIQIKAPDSLSQGSPARVQVIVAGGGDTATFRWTVSAGTITSGQGTRSIAVDTKGLAGSSITSTVALGNLPSQCDTTSASATTLIGP